jgi:hypothetical protein
VHERLVNRAARDYLGKAFSLRVIEVTFHMYIGRYFFNEPPIRDVTVLAIIRVNA